MKTLEISESAGGSAAQGAAFGSQAGLEYLRRGWPDASDDVLLDALAILNDALVSR